MLEQVRTILSYSRMLPKLQVTGRQSRSEAPFLCGFVEVGCEAVGFAVAGKGEGTPAGGVHPAGAVAGSVLSVAVVD